MKSFAEFSALQAHGCVLLLTFWCSGWVGANYRNHKNVAKISRNQTNGAPITGPTKPFHARAKCRSS
jgi:hypothetical protein